MVTTRTCSSYQNQGTTDEDRDIKDTMQHTLTVPFVVCADMLIRSKRSSHHSVFGRGLTKTAANSTARKTILTHPPLV